MKAVIIEDEELTAERLANLIKSQTDLEVVSCLHSVKSAIQWLSTHPIPDVVFLDIQLGDGSGFDILQQIETFPHIIFTTAFDQYAIDAFKYNSVDYLLKPVKGEALRQAILKLKKMNAPSINTELINELTSSLNTTYKSKFLVKIGLKFYSHHIDKIAYFYSEEGESYLRTLDAQSAIIDHSLDAVEKLVDPSLFFRVNRHLIIRSEQITSIDSYFNNRLSLQVSPSFHEAVIVSRDRVKLFKQWLGE